MVWIGNSVSPQVLVDLFGVDDINSVDPKIVRCPFLQLNRSTFPTQSSSYSLFSRNWVARCPSRSGTSSPIEESKGEEPRSCLSSDKIWMAQRSNSATCWWKIRIMGHFRI